MTSRVSRYRYFIAISPGLESLLLDELGRIGATGRMTPGGVECTGTIEMLWSIHRNSRLAESVRLRLRPFEAKSFVQFEQGLRRLSWHAYLRRGWPFEVSVTCQGSRLYHTDAIAERAQRIVHGSWDAGSASMTDAARSEHPPQAECPKQKLHIRNVRDIFQVSIDASGERLHRRGYRTHVGSAPLRETLAAATIQLLLTMVPTATIARLWDPCCGSGTLLGEWLLLRLGKPPCTGRRFAFESWPIHEPQAYSAWVEQHVEPKALDGECLAFGTDSDSRSIAAARHNLALAGIAERCELRVQDFRDAARRIPKDTAVVANLPYGVRLQNRRAATRLFVALDRMLYERSDLRPVVVLNAIAPPDPAACHWRRLATFANGGLRVSAWGLA